MVDKADKSAYNKDDMPKRSSKKKGSRDMNVVASYIVVEATGEDMPTTRARGAS